MMENNMSWYITETDWIWLVVVVADGGGGGGGGGLLFDDDDQLLYRCYKLM